MAAAGAAGISSPIKIKSLLSLLRGNIFLCRLHSWLVFPNLPFAPPIPLKGSVESAQVLRLMGHLSFFYDTARVPT